MEQNENESGIVEPEVQSDDIGAETSELDNSTETPDVEAPEKTQDEGDDRKWYALQCFSLQEYKIRDRILDMMERELAKKVFRVLLPEEETVEIKNNERQERVTKIYPGYLFVEMLPDEQAWFQLQSIPGVAKLIGERNAPTPVTSKEIDKILRKIGDKTKKVEVDFEVQEMIKVISGPFRGYSGVISEINLDRGKLKSLISIFGRETPVELDFDQVEKAVGS